MAFVVALLVAAFALLMVYPLAMTGLRVATDTTLGAGIGATPLDDPGLLAVFANTLVLVVVEPLPSVLAVPEPVEIVALDPVEVLAVPPDAAFAPSSPELHPTPVASTTDAARHSPVTEGRRSEQSATLGGV